MQHTLGVRERALFLVTELSHAKAARTLDELRGLGVSHGQLNDRRSGTHMEVKLGLVFTGTEQTGRHRRRLLDRHLMGGTGSWTTFAERFTAACAALGVYEAERILFGSDGAAAIRWIRERSFPDAIELLDWYHLSEQLRFGIGGQHEAVLSTALGAAMHGDVEALLAILRSHARSLERTTTSRRSAAGPSSATSSTTDVASPTTASCRWPARGPWRRAWTSLSVGASRLAA